MAWAIWPAESTFILENKPGHPFILLWIKCKLQTHRVTHQGSEENRYICVKGKFIVLQVIHIHGESNHWHVRFLCMKSETFTMYQSTIHTNSLFINTDFHWKFWVLSISVMRIVLKFLNKISKAKVFLFSHFWERRKCKLLPPERPPCAQQPVSSLRARTL